jgi:hypothetical protein
MVGVVLLTVRSGAHLKGFWKTCKKGGQRVCLLTGLTTTGTIVKRIADGQIELNKAGIKETQ